MDPGGEFALPTSLPYIIGFGVIATGKLVTQADMEGPGKAIQEVGEAINEKVSEIVGYALISFYVLICSTS